MCDHVMLSCDEGTCSDHVNSPTITCHLNISNDNDFKNKRETERPWHKHWQSTQDFRTHLAWWRVDVSLTVLQYTPGVWLFDIIWYPTDWWQHTNNAQQAFSAASIPTLQNALPSLEKLYTSWERAASKSCYKSFVPALTAGMEKLNTYYQWSVELDMHIMAMGDVSFWASSYKFDLC